MVYRGALSAILSLTSSGSGAASLALASFLIVCHLLNVELGAVWWLYRSLSGKQQGSLSVINFQYYLSLEVIMFIETKQAN